MSADTGASPINLPPSWPRRGAYRAELAVRRLLAPARRCVPMPRSGTLLAIVASAVLFLLLLMLFVDVPEIEAARTLPAFVEALFQAITGFGKAAWFMYPLAAVMIAIIFAPPDLPRPVQRTLAAVMVRAGFLFIAIGLPSLFTGIVKRIIGRARPFVGGSPDAFLYHPFSWHPAYASMPSGHTTTAFAAAFAIGAIWPRGRTALWIYAVLILTSRLVITAHHPSDVVAGAIVGGLGAWLVQRYFAARNLGFGVTEQGVIAHFPGPSRRRIKAVARAVLAE
jgi:undecaprenyl-diphosphatase